jgi:hypothetical protein
MTNLQRERIRFYFVSQQSAKRDTPQTSTEAIDEITGMMTWPVPASVDPLEELFMSFNLIVDWPCPKVTVLTLLFS